MRLPSVEPLLPCGRYSSRDLARAALLSALLRDGARWGVPLVARWGHHRDLSPEVVRELLDELADLGHVAVAASTAAQSCLRWRARRAA